MSGNEQHPAKVLLAEIQPWERDQLLGLCRVHCEAVSRAGRLQDLSDSELPADATILSTFIYSRVTAEQLARLPKLRLIATRSTGFDHIDLDACGERGIVVCNVPRYGERTVAEHAFALLLALTRKIHRSYERTIRGDFSIQGLRGTELYGKTFGALGAGAIARHALGIARGFGMRTIAYDIKPDEQAAREIGFEYVDFDTLLRESDILSIHVPHTDQTHHMIDDEALSKLPDGAIVINTARGGIIEPQALINALVSGKVSGAGLDVLEAEAAISEEAELMSGGYDVDTLRRIVQNHALLRLPNVIITPHVAFNSDVAVRKIIETTVANIHAFLEGKPQNVVNPQVQPA